MEDDLGVEVHQIDPKMSQAAKKNKTKMQIQEEDLEEEGLMEEENMEGGLQGSSQEIVLLAIR